MKMIAIGTIHGRELVKAADTRDFRSRAKYKDLIASPGEDVDTEKFGISDDEAEQMIKDGVARRKTKEVPDDGPAERKRAPASGRNAGGAGSAPESDPLDNLTDDEIKARVPAGANLPADATRADMIAAIKAAA
jgi:hypothetical protein